ncbi:hypothetical protein [Mucisphaera calidilacus]|uniref:Endonuclease III n=1 Tax=Mucisphaera calidilacus TaxID=2527982 RepID=A0A518BW69_9BACT|nr:hypothetical protein [Mucisphaera calidilacus]QDU71218.1 hypothetical protein Pan265_10670 [Mucisphaera calidilacus]
MKHEIDTKALQALLKKVKPKKACEPFDALAPVTQLVVSLLHWRATQAESDAAFDRIMEEMVDINDLRVSSEAQIVELIGDHYPCVAERTARIKEALNELFRREHAVAMTSVESAGKKEQRQYLETLPGVPPFVISRVMLLSFGGHAFPIDERILTLMTKAGVFTEDITPAEAEALLLRQIKAADTLEAYTNIQVAADKSRWTHDEITPHAPMAAAALAESQLKNAVRARKTALKEAETKKSAKKSTKKKTTKKTTKSTKTTKTSKTTKKKAAPAK